MFGDDMIQAVWDKGRTMPEQNPEEWRRDQCGAWMRRDQYGNEGSEFGWKIENPTTGTPDDVDNLQPVHCSNDFDIASGQPHCRTTADRTGLLPGQSITRPRNRDL